MNFAPVVIRRQSLLAPVRTTREEKKWGSYRTLVKEQMAGSVSGVAFSPRFPYEMAAAADTKISIVNSTLGEVRRTVGRSKYVAHSPNFKPDGKLLVAGYDSGSVQVFDLSNRSMLREFKGHTGEVWTTKFSPDGRRVLSGSDDCTVRMWDLATGKCMLTMNDATDYVHAQAPSPSSKHIWCVGSYDGKARLYDLRSKSIICTMDHGCQIDDMVVLPGGLRAVTVGGTNVKVWDLLNSGRLEYRVTNHSKAVTSCVVHPENDRLITAGVDGQVKVMDLTFFNICAAMYYQDSIISLAISPDGKRIATGSVEGVAEIRVAKQFDKGLPNAPTDGGLKERQFQGWGSGFAKPEHEGPRPGTRRYFNRGAYAKPDPLDIVIKPTGRKPRMPYDHLLKSFAHGQALAAAAVEKDPAILLAVVQELAVRKALRRAVETCSDAGIVDILFIVMRHIDKPERTARMIDIMNLVLDNRADDFGGNPEMDRLLNQILDKVKKQVRIDSSFQSVLGYVDSVHQAAQV